ncbi:hypothetical protein BC826DRAFT_972556 [Russula brevipes]|nr:hypothetical protein BC826DRAFT_972556 [Russula brevipes]
MYVERFPSSAEEAPAVKSEASEALSQMDALYRRQWGFLSSQPRSKELTNSVVVAMLETFVPWLRRKAVYATTQPPEPPPPPQSASMGVEGWGSGSGWMNITDASDAKKSIGVGGNVGVKKKISQVDARVPQTCVVVGLTSNASQPPPFYTLKRVGHPEHAGQRKDLKTMENSRPLRWNTK